MRTFARIVIAVLFLVALGIAVRADINAHRARESAASQQLNQSFVPPSIRSQDLALATDVRELRIKEAEAELRADLVSNSLIWVSRGRPRRGDSLYKLEVLVNGSPAELGIWGDTYKIPVDGAAVTLRWVPNEKVEPAPESLPNTTFLYVEPGKMLFGVSPINDGADCSYAGNFQEAVCEMYPQWQPRVQISGAQCLDYSRSSRHEAAVAARKGYRLNKYDEYLYRSLPGYRSYEFAGGSWANPILSAVDWVDMPEITLGDAVFGPGSSRFVDYRIEVQNGVTLPLSVGQVLFYVPDSVNPIDGLLTENMTMIRMVGSEEQPILQKATWTEDQRIW